MLKRVFFKSAIFSLVLLSSASLTVFAQDDKDAPRTDPNQRSRNFRQEVKKVYKDWVEKDVAYIITSEEKKAFEALKTDEERENFIESFWRRRDPNPDTEENEYREEYYERIAYANERFASGIPGWMTDRGRVYITWGKPDSIDSRPSGGAYDRPTWEGGGTTTTYPFEVWFYRHLEGIGDGIEIEFVDPTGTGEYRIARNANEKDAMLYIPGAGQTTGELLGVEDRADRIAGRVDKTSYQREQDTPFRRLEIIAGLSRPPQVKYSDLQGMLGADAGVFDNNPLNFDIRVDFFRQSDDRVITAFTVQADNKELVFENVGGLQTAQMNIFGRVMAVSGKRSGIFEDSVTTTATAEELAEFSERKSVYQRAIALTPGVYKVDVIARDVKSGNRGIRSLGFTVPKYDDQKLDTSTLVLASTLRGTTERDIGGMFVIGTAKVIPNLSGIYKRGQEVGLFIQVYNAGIDQTTLRPAVDVEYVLMKGDKVVYTIPEQWDGLSDSGQRLTLAKLITTQSLDLGEYEIKIRIKDRVTGQTLEPKGKFTVIQ